MKLLSICSWAITALAVSAADCTGAAAETQECREKAELYANNPVAWMNDHMGRVRPPGFRPGAASRRRVIRREILVDQPNMVRPAYVPCSARNNTCAVGQTCVARRKASSVGVESKQESWWCVGQPCFMNAKVESQKKRCPVEQQCVSKPWVQVTDVGGLCADKSMQCRQDSECPAEWKCEKRPAGDGPLCEDRMLGCGLCTYGKPLS